MQEINIFLFMLNAHPRAVKTRKVAGKQQQSWINNQYLDAGGQGTQNDEINP